MATLDQLMGSFSEEEQSDIKAMADEMMLECGFQGVQEESKLSQSQVAPLPRLKLEPPI